MCARVAGSNLQSVSFRVFRRYLYVLDRSVCTSPRELFATYQLVSKLAYSDGRVRSCLDRARVPGRPKDPARAYCGTRLGRLSAGTGQLYSFIPLLLTKNKCDTISRASKEYAHATDEPCVPGKATTRLVTCAVRRDSAPASKRSDHSAYLQ